MSASPALPVDSPPLQAVVLRILVPEPRSLLETPVPIVGTVAWCGRLGWSESIGRASDVCLHRVCVSRVSTLVTLPSRQSLEDTYIRRFCRVDC